MVVGDRNGIAAPFAITGVMEALMALALLSGNRRAVNTLFSAALIVVAVPAMGATFIAGLEGMAGDHSLVAFAVALEILVDQGCGRFAAFGSFVDSAFAGGDYRKPCWLERDCKLC